MAMRDRDSQRICGICLRISGELQQRSNHMLNLAFLRATNTNDGLLNLTRRVFKHRQFPVDRGDNRYAAGLSQLEGGIGILRHKHLFDSEIVRLELG
ncbi:Uncharacterised protein [Salmonella enterica subsp. arizonae]|nr:Uncharacterised protein [Salmonella enterica subsp. arizonae]